MYFGYSIIEKFFRKKRNFVRMQNAELSKLKKLLCLILYVLYGALIFDEFEKTKNLHILQRALSICEQFKY